MLSITFITF